MDMPFIEAFQKIPADAYGTPSQSVSRTKKVSVQMCCRHGKMRLFTMQGLQPAICGIMDYMLRISEIAFVHKRED